MSYVWGIRLGILLFVFFALEGGVMASTLKHTVGGNDNGNGLPLVNWNRMHGDLRIAHFFGMHSLQLLPLAGYYLAKTSKSIVIFSIVYAAIVIGLLIQALMGIPLF
jgi:hypothetical protein